MKDPFSNRVAIGPFKPTVRLLNHKFMNNPRSACLGVACCWAERGYKHISAGVQSGIDRLLVLRGIFTLVVLLTNVKSWKVPYQNTHKFGLCKPSSSQNLTHFNFVKKKKNRKNFLGTNFKYFDIYKNEKYIFAYNLSFKKCCIDSNSSKPALGQKTYTS